MKKVILLFLCFSGRLNILSAQSSWGLFINSNITTQTNFNPTRPQDETFMWNWQKSISPGIYYNTFIRKKLSLRYNLLYNTKGFNEYNQVGYVGNSNSYNTVYKNVFNFLSFQHNILYPLNTKEKFKLNCFAGYELSYLLNYSLKPPTNPYTQYRHYPYNQYNNLNKFLVSGQIGVGVNLNNTMEINVSHSRDVSDLVHTETLIAKNWSFNFQLLLNMKKILFSN